MLLLLIRHGEPVRGGGDADLDRPLAAAGIATIETLSRTLRRLALVPQRLVTSPAQRCVESAAILAAAAPPGAAPEPLPQLALGTPPALALRALMLSGAAATVLAVSHEPVLAGLAGLLLGGAARGGVHFDCGTCACFDIQVGRAAAAARLRWWLGPVEFTRLAAGE